MTCLKCIIFKINPTLRKLFDQCILYKYIKHSHKQKKKKERKRSNYRYNILWATSIALLNLACIMGEPPFQEFQYSEDKQRKTTKKKTLREKSRVGSSTKRIHFSFDAGFR